jgi:hypothetical protein
MGVSRADSGKVLESSLGYLDAAWKADRRAETRIRRWPEVFEMAKSKSKVWGGADGEGVRRYR